MEVSLYNLEGKEKKKIKLPDKVFNIRLNTNLWSQVINNQKSNRRRNIAKTKDRSEVKGGGRKPWRQKGTGRARAGSNRSPLWKGGGVTFGPRGERNFRRLIPKKMKKKALLMAFSQKLKNNELIVIEDPKISKPKTKIVADIIKKLSLEGKSCLIALPQKDDKIIRASRNIPKLKIEELRNLNALDISSYRYLIITESDINELK